MNQDLIQEVYSELVELGWHEVNKKQIMEQTNPCSEIDIFSYPANTLINITPNPKTSGWIFWIR